MSESLLAKIANAVRLKAASPALYKLRRKYRGKLTNEALLLKKFPQSVRDRQKLTVFSKQSLRERFFLNDLDRKEFYINLMTSLAGFDAILDDADLVHENKFRACGSELYSFGERIDWHFDFKSGTRWKPIFYSRIDYRVPADADVRVPWEVSRFYQAVWLGKAYWLSRSEAHTDKFKELIGDWIKENPVGYGVNWCAPQEAAIRGTNIIVGLLYFMGSTKIDDKFLMDILCSLFEHGIFAMYNLGRARKDGNHYLCSIVGLLYLGILFYDTKTGRRWVWFARKELEREIVSQVQEDGTRREGSTSRLREAAELFTAAYVLLKLNGFSISGDFAGRLEKMLGFMTTATMHDGRVPNTGDEGTSRLFRMKSKTDFNDHRDLLSVGAALFGRGDMKSAADGFSELGLLLTGGEGFERFSLAQGEGKIPSAVYYRDGGIAFMRTEKDFCSFNFGFTGISRRSGQAHNDLLSFTISGKNQFIVDRGSYPGSPGKTIGDRLRSTYSHNTVVIDGTEQVDFSSTRSPADSRSRPALLNWQSSQAQDIIEAEHHEYERLLGPVTHRRGVTFNKHQRTFRVEDSLIGTGMHIVELMFHFAPELGVVDLGRNFLALEGEEFALMKFQHPFMLDNWNHSPGCGILQTARTARVKLEVNLPLRIETFIFITSNEDDMNYLLNRIQSLGSA